MAWSKEKNKAKWQQNPENHVHISQFCVMSELMLWTCTEQPNIQKKCLYYVIRSISCGRAHASALFAFLLIWKGCKRIAIPENKSASFFKKHKEARKKSTMESTSKELSYCHPHPQVGWEYQYEKKHDPKRKFEKVGFIPILFPLRVQKVE